MNEIGRMSSALFRMLRASCVPVEGLRFHREFNIILEEQIMKKVEIDGTELIIYEDGSIRIPHKDKHLCLDVKDISFLYKESKKALYDRAPNRKETGRACR